jgi:hypothetical protein
MKKTIFLLALICTLSGCGYAPIDGSQHIIITGAEKYDNTYSNYYGRGNCSMIGTLTSYNFKFRDRTKKFNIGDTITFTKYKK